MAMVMKGPMKSIRDYTIIIRPDDNGTFVAYLPALDGCHAWGRTPEEARTELDNVFDMIAEELEESGRPFPDEIGRAHV